MHNEKIKLKWNTKIFPAVSLNERSCHLYSLPCQPGFQDKCRWWCFCWGGMKYFLNQLLGEVAEVDVECLSQQYE